MHHAFQNIRPFFPKNFVSEFPCTFCTEGHYSSEHIQGSFQNFPELLPSVQNSENRWDTYQNLEVPRYQHNKWHDHVIFFFNSSKKQFVSMMCMQCLWNLKWHSFSSVQISNFAFFFPLQKSASQMLTVLQKACGDKATKKS